MPHKQGPERGEFLSGYPPDCERAQVFLWCAATLFKHKARINPVNPIILIPARMGSSRLPGKPMALINGRPMILHVLDRAREAAIAPIAVACCDIEVFDAVIADGGVAVMTDPKLPSGSDRAKQAADLLDPSCTYNIVINLQGDLPTLARGMLSAVLAPLEDRAFDLATLVAPIESAEEAARSSVVKAVCAFAPGQSIASALYFSRATVPWGAGPLWHHIGIYAWRREALARFVALPESPLEQREKLEQLRALEAGMRVACAMADHAPFGIDTLADLERARAML